MVWGAVSQEGQRSFGALPILTRKLLRDEQKPERSWESAERYGRGREDSSAATRGALPSRTELSGRELIARVTTSVRRELIVSL